MIDTRLILIEGLPGSGKTSTARNIASAVAQSGADCQCYFEWSEDHPIPIGDHLQLAEVMRSSLAREPVMLRDWQQYVEQWQPEQRVTVMESRFWQSGVMLMYIAGLSKDGVMASSRRLIETIQALKPVLIYYSITQPAAFAARTIQIKDGEWRQAGVTGSWSAYIFEAFESQQWFTQRGLCGQAGMAALLEDWSAISRELYEQVPFPKIAIQDPHENWPVTMEKIRAFLGLN
jgi:thymidylate kinase